MKSPLRFAAVSLLAIAACAASSAHADELPPLPVPAESTVAPTPAAPSTSRPRSSEPVRLVIVQPHAEPGHALASAPMEPLTAPEIAPQPKTRRRWYGWQPLITDGAAAMLFALGLSNGAVELAYAAPVPYLLGGPIFHLAHGRPVIAAVSLALRAGLPFALGGGAWLLDRADTRSGGDGFGAAMTGGLIGIATAVALDAAVLSRETISVEPKETSSFRLAPQLAIDRKGAQFGLGGTF